MNPPTSATLDEVWSTTLQASRNLQTRVVASTAVAGERMMSLYGPAMCDGPNGVILVALDLRARCHSVFGPCRRYATTLNRSRAALKTPRCTATTAVLEWLHTANTPQPSHTLDEHSDKLPLSDSEGRTGLAQLWYHNR